MFANLFSLHEVNFDQCGNVKMTVNIPKGTELSGKPFSNSWVCAVVRNKLLQLLCHPVSRGLDTH